MDSRGLTRELFGTPRAPVGMLHADALPGSPGHRGGGLEAIVDRVVAEAALYRDAGFHGLLLENMHDRPYLRGAVGPETVAALAVIGREVRRAVPLPLGVQVLAAANREALAVALACDACFVRVEGYVFAHVADEGTIEAQAGALLRYRAALGARDVHVFADVKKKHAAHALTADVDLAATARAAEFACADGVIVTGTETGAAADPADVTAAVEAVGLPAFVGSGVTAQNLACYAGADGFIVGSAVKRGGDWRGPVDADRVRALAAAFAALPERGVDLAGVRRLAGPHDALVTLDPFELVRDDTLGEWGPLLDAIDVLFIGADELRLAGDAVPALCEAAGPRLRWLVLEAAADRGRLVDVSTGRRHAWEARAERVADVTGAGDAFAGGFLAGWIAHADLGRALAQGVVAASFAVEDWGARGLLAATAPAARARLDAWFPGLTSAPTGMESVA